MSRRRRPQAIPYDPILSRGIIVVLLLMLTALITLSFFGKAGTVGVVINDWVLSFLFGGMRFVVPLILLIIAWFAAKDRHTDFAYRPTHILGAVLFLLTSASLLHLSFDPANMWTEAIAGHGGGAFGMPAYLLKTYAGALASAIILIALLIVSVLLIFNTTVAGFILLHQKVFGFLGNGLVAIVKKLFVRKEAMDAEGNFAEASEDVEESDEEEMEEGDDVPKRRFLARAVASDTAEEADEEETEEADDAPAGPWAKKVVIKHVPGTTLLSDKRGKPTSGDIKANSQTIQDTFHQFGIDVDMSEIRVGPTVTQYSLKPHKGIKLTRITALSNDLALALAAHPIRIEAPIPGKSLVGIEVPNQKTAMVGFKELLESKEYHDRPHNLMIALGKDVAGKVWWADLPRMPHLLIAGATGSGKTVCVNTIIMSLLFQNTAETVRFIMVDPKRVELTLYNGIPHLLTPVITNVQKTVNALKWTTGEMERRFELLAAAGNRDIASYNAKHPNSKIPYIVFVIDELADLMASAANEVEAGIIRLAQMARAVGIHLIVATQRPSVDVITGLMKANIPARIAFSVASLIDSRTILDGPGAEKLLGRGDMLFQTAELSKPVRIQGAFISEEELKSVVEYLKGDEAPEYDDLIVEKNGAGGKVNMFGGGNDDQDPLFQEAKTEIIRAGKASASFLQRKLSVGYARAARLLDELEAAGVIGPGDGAKPREILAAGGISHDTMDAGGHLNVFGNKNAVPAPVRVAADEEITNEEEGEADQQDADEDPTPTDDDGWTTVDTNS